MCFTAEMSASLTVMGLVTAAMLYRRTSNRRLATAMIFFCTMEGLQAVQQWSPSLATSLDDPRCRLRWNQFLAVLGYVHIQFQPYFSNLMHQSGKAGIGKDREWTVVKRLCLVKAALGLARLGFVFLGGGPNREDLAADHAAFLERSMDWLEAPQTCMCVYARARSRARPPRARSILTRGAQVQGAGAPRVGLPAAAARVSARRRGPALAAHVRPHRLRLARQGPRDRTPAHLHGPGARNDPRAQRPARAGVHLVLHLGHPDMHRRFRLGARMRGRRWMGR